MLTYLHVRNIALIDEVTLDLHNHLNIFSGETGAGKSMLIDSIQFAIGNRTSKQIIRKGQQCAYVKLGFTDHSGMGIAYIEENGFPYEDKIIELERTLYATGRTVYKINGVTCARQTVREIAALLIDVHGQHEPQSLLDVTTHIDMLDSFGDEAFKSEKLAYKSVYEAWQGLKAEINKQHVDERKKLQMKDMLTFQIQDIAACKLKQGEEERLKEEYEVLSHGEKIMLQCQKAYECLEGGHKMGDGATELAGRAAQAFQDISHISEELRELHEQLLAVEAQLQDVTYQMRRYVDDIDYSPELLEEVQQRLDTIYRLKQKYGNSVEEILEYKASCEQELEELMNSEENKEKLLAEYHALEQEVQRAAGVLLQKRIDLATDIESKINHHLKDLQMPHAEFKVSIKPLESCNKQGCNDVEFLIRTNLGEDMHSLSKIASGGEISRVMLAIKTVLVLGDTIDTVIFDEIDTGISGLAAQKVGEKLATISRMRQVICITHLPQIAAMGDNHYLIEKHVQDGQTKTQLTMLAQGQIHEELCRLMGGLVTANTLQSAKDIKQSAIEYKQGIC
ncbi:MAG: DNA repair protein RecN [Cellulosilyticaceae bacterium]